MWVGVGLWPAQGVETGRTAMPMPAGTALQSLPVASRQSSAPGCLVLSGALEQLGPLAWKSQGKGLSRQRSNPSGRVRAGAEPRAATVLEPPLSWIPSSTAGKQTVFCRLKALKGFPGFLENSSHWRGQVSHTCQPSRTITSAQEFETSSTY